MQFRDAITRAARLLPEVFDDARDRQLQLEGVEKSADGAFWKVTFSYQVQDESSVVNFPSRRLYRTVKLRDTDGELVGAQNGNLLAVL